MIFYYDTAQTWDDTTLFEQPFIEADSPMDAFDELVEAFGDDLVTVYTEQESVYSNDIWIEAFDASYIGM